VFVEYGFDEFLQFFCSRIVTKAGSLIGKNRICVVPMISFHGTQRETCQIRGMGGYGIPTYADPIQAMAMRIAERLRNSVGFALLFAGKRPSLRGGVLQCRDVSYLLVIATFAFDLQGFVGFGCRTLQFHF
jgi:hypothetical protein